MANLSCLPLQKSMNNPNVTNHMVVWVRPNAVALKKYVRWMLLRCGSLRKVKHRRWKGISPITVGNISSVLFSCSVVSDSLWPSGLQHARPPCPSSTPGVYSNSCPLSRWCHPTVSSSVIPFSSCLQASPVSGSFSNESALCIRWPKYWSFSFNISPYSEYSGLISLRID